MVLPPAFGALSALDPSSMLAPMPVRSDYSSGLHQDLDYAPHSVRLDYSAGLHQDLDYAARYDLDAAGVGGAGGPGGAAAPASAPASAPAPDPDPLCAPRHRAAAPA